MITCPSCRSELPRNAKFCSRCGAGVHLPPTQPIAQASETAPTLATLASPPQALAGFKDQRARSSTNAFAVAGGVIAFFALFPGSTSVTLCVLELVLCYRIGRIYLGDEYSLGDQITSYAWVFLAALVGQVVASVLLEMLTFVPFIGWLIKGVVAASIIKILGSLLSHHYRKTMA